MWVVKAVTSDGELGLVWVSFLWAVGDNDMAIGYCVVFRDLGFLDEKGHISDWELFIALGKMTKFIGETACPDPYVFGLFNEIATFIVNSSVVINDGCSYGSEWCCRWCCDKAVDGDWLTLLQIVPWWWGELV